MLSREVRVSSGLYFKPLAVLADEMRSIANWSKCWMLTVYALQLKDFFIIYVLYLISEVVNINIPLACNFFNWN